MARRSKKRKSSRKSKHSHTSGKGLGKFRVQTRGSKY